MRAASEGLGRVGQSTRVQAAWPSAPHRHPSAFPRMRPVHAAPWLLVGGFALALWPHWQWAAARLADGSDDPLGVVALLALVGVLVRFGPGLRAEPAPRAMAAAVALAVAATVGAVLPSLGVAVPPLAASVLAALALAAVVAAVVPAGTPRIPLAGLAVLALPVVSSLQFYAGWPLRVVAAEAGARLLALAGFEVAREGTALRVDGTLVIVDAPCSGVQMVWLAYFAACATAAWLRVPDRAFARRLVGVGALVLAGNVLRNAVLVGLEAKGVATGGWLHESVGLVALAIVCGAVVAWVAAGRARTQRVVVPEDGMRLGPRALAGFAVLAAACGAAPAWLGAGQGEGAGRDGIVEPQAAVADRRAPARADFREPPNAWDGAPLRPLALGAVEARFAARFPGRIERLTDGTRTLVWRDVRVPTRMLHPAADCYRGLGWRIAGARLERDGAARLWRCFVATAPGGGRGLRICERIEGADGTSYTDASAWFWAATLGRSHGPWQAVTVAAPLAGDAS